MHSRSKDILQEKDCYPKAPDIFLGQDMELKPVKKVQRQSPR
jgi:hypothetical protein